MLIRAVDAQGVAQVGTTCVAPGMITITLRQTRAEWERELRRIMGMPRPRSVGLSDIKMAIGADGARVSFNQGFRSDNHADRSVMAPRLVRQGKPWLITAEAFTPR